jgi:hypothetical protein
MNRLLLPLLLIMLLGACRGADKAEKPEATGDAYYLSSCAHCGGMLGSKGDTLDHAVTGRDVRFCSPPCAAEFARDPIAGFEAVDARMAADQRPHYPLRTSLVTGAPLPARPVEVIIGNRLFLAADRREAQSLAADPDAYFRSLDRAVIEAQTPGYGMKRKCPVQGDILESDVPFDIVIANRMIRVCCARCGRVVRARPSQYLAMVDYANRANGGHADD